jgi:pimeloyl-ACP methyl ester carboxylesterase
MQAHFDGKAFDYQTLRAMAYATFGGSEPGEVLTTVERIDDGDTEAWHREWRRTADLVDRRANDALDAGHRRTARFAFLRAHTYYRTAEFFLPAQDPRRRPTHRRSREAFRAGMDLLDRPPEIVSIPYEDTTLPGYLFRTTESTKPRPTIVCLGGLDSLGEELYFLCGVPEALARGYDVLLFEGPGQGAPLRYEGLTARPDWEHVVGPVIDFLESREDVESTAVGLIGVSMGGYYAPRAAAFDDRIDACVAFDHMHDVWLTAAADNPRIAKLLLRAPDAVVDGLAAIGERFDVGARTQMATGRWVFGVGSAAELQRAMREYSLTDLAHRVECPTLVLAGENDHFVPLGMAETFANAIAGPTTLRVFTTEEGAGEHCQMGNVRLAAGEIYDWLDDTLSDPAKGPS